MLLVDYGGGGGGGGSSSYQKKKLNGKIFTYFIHEFHKHLWFVCLYVRVFVSENHTKWN